MAMGTHLAAQVVCRHYGCREVGRMLINEEQEAEMKIRLTAVAPTFAKAAQRWATRHDRVSNQL